MKIAVVKPDHLGDLILSSAAIRALAKHFPDLTLMISEKMFPLANFLFPSLPLCGIELPHLGKSQTASLKVPDLRAYDHVVFLRTDGVLNAEWMALRSPSFTANADNHHQHQSALDYATVSSLIGDYDIDAHHFGDNYQAVAAKARQRPQTIGLSLGSGFHTNSWPPSRWIEIGSRLLRAGCALRCIGGPAERPIIAFILSQLGLGMDSAIIGDHDFGVFLSKIAALDLVIASDGGSAHLCSLAAPILSIFGPSPFRRFAPFARWNRLLVRPMPCAPCYQFHKTVVNCCVTAECMSAITADVLFDAVFRQATTVDGPRVEILPGNYRLYTGVSHRAC